MRRLAQVCSIFAALKLLDTVWVQSTKSLAAKSGVAPVTAPCKTVMRFNVQDQKRDLIDSLWARVAAAQTPSIFVPLQLCAFVGWWLAWVSFGLSSGLAVAAIAEATRPALELRPSDVVSSALENDLALQTARRTLALQAQNVRVARGAFDPKLATRTSTQRGLGAAAAPLGALRSQSQTALDVTWLVASGATIRLTQDIDRQRRVGLTDEQGGSRRVQVSQPLLRRFGSSVTKAPLYNAEAALRVAAAGLERQAALVVANALLAYTGLQQAQAAVNQTMQAYDLAVRVHELNQALVAAGRSAKIVLFQSESDVASARLGVVQAENNERLAMRALAQAMGRTQAFESMRLVLTEELGAVPSDALLEADGLVRETLAHSAELLAAREAVQVARRELDVASNELLPTLDLVASRSIPSGARSLSTRADTSVGVNVEINFDQEPRKLARSVAQANLDTAQAQLIDAERQVRDAAVDALNSYRFASAQVELSVGASQLAQQQQEAEVTRQRLGQLSQLELSNAQRAVAAANAQWRDAMLQLLRSRLDMSRLAGSLLRTMNAQQAVDDWIRQATQEP